MMSALRDIELSATDAKKGDGPVMERRNLANFKRACFLSYLGDQMHELLFIWAVWSGTESVAATGLSAILVRVPYWTVSLFSGVVVDNFHRRHLLLFTSTLSAVLIVILAVGLGMLYWPVVYVCALCLSTLKELEHLSFTAIVSELTVSKDKTSYVFARDLSKRIGRLSAAIAAGLLALAFDYGTIYFLIAAIYSVMAFAVIRLQVIERRSNHGKALRVNVADAFKHVARRGPVLASFLIFFIYALPYGVAIYIVAPVLSEQSVDLGLGGYSLIIFVYSVGALAGSMLLAGRRYGNPLRSVSLSATAISVVLGALFASQITVWVTMVFFIAGFLQPVMEVCIMRIIYADVSPANHGAVMAVHRVMNEMGIALGLMFCSIAATETTVLPNLLILTAVAVPLYGAVYLWGKHDRAEATLLTE